MEVPIYQAAGGYGHEARFGSHEFDLFWHIVDEVGDSSYCFCMNLDEYDFLVHMNSVSVDVMVVWVDVPVGDITESCHEIYMGLWWIVRWFDQADGVMNQVFQLSPYSSVDLQLAWLGVQISQQCLHLVLAPARC